MIKRLETRSFESPDSTNVKRVEWTGEPLGHGVAGLGELRVHFLNGSAYRYAGIRVDVFEQLRGADSVGGTFDKVVKKVYKGEKLVEAVLKRNPGPTVWHYAPSARSPLCGVVGNGVCATDQLADVTCPDCVARAAEDLPK